MPRVPGNIYGPKQYQRRGHRAITLSESALECRVPNYNLVFWSEGQLALTASPHSTCKQA